MDQKQWTQLRDTKSSCNYRKIEYSIVSYFQQYKWKEIFSISTYNEIFAILIFYMGNSIRFASDFYYANDNFVAIYKTESNYP